MKKIVLLAVLALVLVAMPAFASVQNVKVSGEIDSTFVYRNQFDLGFNDSSTSYVGDQKQNFFMTQTFLRVDADLTDKVSATVRLLNERVWGNNDITGSATINGNTYSGSLASNNAVDVNLAYVTIKEMLYSPLTVVVGRQEFHYGNSFVIDSAGTNNTVNGGGLEFVAGDLSKRTAMDGIRAILDYNPLTIDLVYVKVNANNLVSTGATKDDVDLMGVNANYKLGDKYNSVLEGYFWTKIDNTHSDAGNTGIKAKSVYMPGVHAQTNPIDGLMLSGELAYQGGVNDYADLANPVPGTSVNGKRSALGYQGIASYQIPVLKQYVPVATAAFTHVSGDKEPTLSTKNNSAWDPMFENQGGGKIYNALFNLTDSNILTAKGSIKPIEDVTASIEWNALWMDKKLDVLAGGIPLVQPDGQSLSVAANPNNKQKFLGNEFDLGLAYAYTEDVTFGATLGVFMPGKAFDVSNKKDATQALVNCDVKF